MPDLQMIIGLIFILIFVIAIVASDVIKDRIKSENEYAALCDTGRLETLNHQKRYHAICWLAQRQG